MRTHVAKKISDLIVEEAKRIRDKYNVKDALSDLSPYLSPWVMKLHNDYVKFFNSYFTSPIGFDWNHSATLGLLDTVLQVIPLFDTKPKVYIDKCQELWKIRQLDNLADKLLSRVGNISEADIVIITHGTPETGFSSLSIDIVDKTRKDAIIIVDAAQMWPLLLTANPWNATINNILKQRRTAIIGDFHKLSGYGLRTSSDISIPMGLSFVVYSEKLYKERLNQASKPLLRKNKIEQEHWDLIYTRKITNGIPSHYIVYPLAFLNVIKNNLKHLVLDSLEVAQKIREEYQATGELTFIIKEIEEEKLKRNNNLSMHVLEGQGYKIIQDQVLPIFCSKGKYFGVVQVYFVSLLMGKKAAMSYNKKLYQYYFSS